MTPAQKVTAVALYREGKGPAAIAAFLGLSYDVVWAYLQFEARFTDGVLSEPRRANIDEPGTSLGNGVGSGAFSPILQTNGVLNTTQNLLNLIAGTGISLAADLAGGVTITNTGTSSFGNQVANSVFAGPTAGAAQLPTFRALIGTDLPQLLALSGASVLNRGYQIVPISHTALASGQNDVYTIPAGKRGGISLSVINLSGGAINSTNFIKVAGVYYQTNAVVSRVNNANATIFSPLTTVPILEAGESFAITAASAGLIVYGYAVIYDNTLPVFSPKLVALVAGANTIYTVPAGKIAYNINQQSSGVGRFVVFNGTAGTRTYTWNVVLPSGTVAVGNQVTPSLSVTTLVFNQQQSVTFGLAAGGFVNITSDSSLAGQVAFLESVIEVPA